MTRWLKQTVAGGVDLPPERRGDCVGAVLASLLARPIDAISNTHGDGWWERLQAEVAPYGYWLARLKEGQGLPKGLWIGVVPSLNFSGSTHVVVCQGSRVIHDPSNLRVYNQAAFDEVRRAGDLFQMWALVPLDPALPVAA